MTKTKFNKAEVITKFNDAGISLKVKKYVNHGVQLTFENGAKINVFKIGNVSVQGKNQEESNRILYGQPESDVKRDKLPEVNLSVENTELLIGEEDDDFGVSNDEDDDLPPW